jgi:hypothetical protein
MNSHNQVKPHQQGAALLVFIAALVMTLALLSYALLGDLGQKLKRQQAQDVGMVLAEAKENLLAFAASIPELYPNNCNGNSCGVGYLPSPDGDNDGSPDGNSSVILGRLPSRQTGMYFFFHHRESTPTGSWLDTPYSIWYAIPATMGVGVGALNIRAMSSTFNNVKPLNSNVLTQKFNALPNATCKVEAEGICLDSNGSGTAATTSPVVALLIYAGSPLTGQNRPSNSAADYLDMSNSDGDRVFVRSFPVGQTCSSNLGNSSSCFNDIVLPITLSDWTYAMESRVKSEFANLSTTLCSASWRAANATHWTVVNQWHTVTNICP